MDPLDLLTEADADTPDEYATPPAVRNLLRAITEARAILMIETESDDPYVYDGGLWENTQQAADILAAALREYGIEPHTPPT